MPFLSIMNEGLRWSVYQTMLGFSLDGWDVFVENLFIPENV